MRTIESELHGVLLDIAPDMHEDEEQALIVAEASLLYEKAAATRSARRTETAKVHEARMMDALLQAMGRLADWTDEDGDGAVDGTGLDASQIVFRAEHAPHRLSSKGFGVDMDILNDADMDIFMRPDVDDHGADDYSLDDGEDRHHPELYSVPGYGSHRSDSNAR
jgi:hypothetical protein